MYILITPRECVYVFTYIFILGDVMFVRLTHIENLTVNGLVNLKNPNETLAQIVLSDEKFILKKPLNLHNNVSICFSDDVHFANTFINIRNSNICFQL